MLPLWRSKRLAIMLDMVASEKDIVIARISKINSQAGLSFSDALKLV